MDSQDYWTEIEYSEYWNVLSENASYNRELVPHRSKWLVITFGSFLSVLGVILLIAVVALLSQSNSTKIGLNRPLQVYLCILHVTSLTFVVPAEVVRECLRRWIFGDQLCHAWLVLSHMLVPMTLWAIFCLILQAVGRQLKLFTACLTHSLTCACLLIGTTLVTCSQLVTAMLTSEDAVFLDVCAMMVDKKYTVLVSLVSYFIPAAADLTLLVLFVCVTRNRGLAMEARDASCQKHLNRFAAIDMWQTESNMCDRVTSYATGQATTEVTTMTTHSNVVKYRENICITLTAYTGACVICWAPFYTANVWLSLGDCRDDVCFDTSMWTLLQWLGYSSSLLFGCCVLVNRDARAPLKRWLNDGGDGDTTDSMTSSFDDVKHV